MYKLQNGCMRLSGRTLCCFYPLAMAAFQTAFPHQTTGSEFLRCSAKSDNFIVTHLTSLSI